MDPPTYPFEETSFMNGPLVVRAQRKKLFCDDAIKFDIDFVLGYRLNSNSFHCNLMCLIIFQSFVTFKVNPSRLNIIYHKVL